MSQIKPARLIMLVVRVSSTFRDFIEKGLLSNPQSNGNELDFIHTLPHVGRYLDNVPEKPVFPCFSNFSC